MKEEVKRWIEQSKADVKSAKNCFKSKDYYLCAFMCQQSVEKVMKALYLQKYKKLRKIHDLTFFAKELNYPEDIIRLCEQLTKVYVETRYPDLGGKIPAKKFTKDDAKKFLNIASKILKWLRKKLS